MKKSFICHSILFLIIAAAIYIYTPLMFPNYQIHQAVLIGGAVYTSAVVTAIISCAYGVFIKNE